jgi:hypothetical protein
LEDDIRTYSARQQTRANPIVRALRGLVRTVVGLFVLAVGIAFAGFIFTQFRDTLTQYFPAFNAAGQCVISAFEHHDYRERAKD